MNNITRLRELLGFLPIKRMPAEIHQFADTIYLYGQVKPTKPEMIPSFSEIISVCEDFFIVKTTGDIRRIFPLDQIKEIRINQQFIKE